VYNDNNNNTPQPSSSSAAIPHAQPQPFYCLFPPVADSVLYLKLKSQLKKQSQLVPLVPLSINEVIDGPIIHWLPSYIENNIYVEMCGTQIQDPQGSYGDKISKYYLEAAKYSGRISAGNFDGENTKYKPVFEIHYKALQSDYKRD
jgi:hypothetical protein